MLFVNAINLRGKSRTAGALFRKTLLHVAIQSPQTLSKSGKRVHPARYILVVALPKQRFLSSPVLLAVVHDATICLVELNEVFIRSNSSIAVSRSDTVGMRFKCALSVLAAKLEVRAVLIQTQQLVTVT